MKYKLFDYVILVMQDGVRSEIRYHQATDQTAIRRAETMALELSGHFDLDTGRVTVIRINEQHESGGSYSNIWTQNIDQQPASAIALAKGAISHGDESQDVKNLAMFLLDEATLTRSQTPKSIATRYTFELFRENRIELSHLTELLLAFAKNPVSLAEVEGAPFPSHEQRRPH